jgi:hypothetical protein
MTPKLYPALFATPDPSLDGLNVHEENNRQMRQLAELCRTPDGEQSITAWLLTSPAVVDRLCVASGLTAKGAVTAGVRALVRMAKENY